MQDPTLEEMRAFLDSKLSAYGEDSATDSAFNREEAIYWYAANYHGGQGSNLYSALSESEFSPGRCSRGPEPESMAALLYADLESEFEAAESSE